MSASNTEPKGCGTLRKAFVTPIDDVRKNIARLQYKLNIENMNHRIITYPPEPPPSRFRNVFGSEDQGCSKKLEMIGINEYSKSGEAL
jgi:hypothetical protein